MMILLTFLSTLCIIVVTGFKDHSIRLKMSLHNSESKPRSQLDESKSAFKKVGIMAGTLSTLGFMSLTSSKVNALPIKLTLDPLPYKYDALEPFISSKTLFYHHDKHHGKYVNTTRDLISGTELEGKDLVTIVKKSFGNNQNLFNNAAQSWNHNFYWKSMNSLNGGGSPKDEKLLSLINKSFGSYENFRKEFAQVGSTLFGSGWAWLCSTPNGLKVLKTNGAENPLILEGGYVPLITMDVWEHAYYLDYQNNRALYVDAFLDHLINWEFASSQLKERI